MYRAMAGSRERLAGEPAATPRRVRLTAPREPGAEKPFMPGTWPIRSSVLRMPRLSMAVSLKAVMDSGVSWVVSIRFWAVTMISSRAMPWAWTWLPSPAVSSMEEMATASGRGRLCGSVRILSPICLIVGICRCGAEPCYIEDHNAGECSARRCLAALGLPCTLNDCACCTAVPLQYGPNGAGGAIPGAGADQQAKLTTENIFITGKNKAVT